MDTDGAKRRVFVNCTVTDNSKRIEEEALCLLQVAKKEQKLNSKHRCTQGWAIC